MLTGIWAGSGATDGDSPGAFRGVPTGRGPDHRARRRTRRGQVATTAGTGRYGGRGVSPPAVRHNRGSRRCRPRAPAIPRSLRGGRVREVDLEGFPPPRVARGPA